MKVVVTETARLIEPGRRLDANYHASSGVQALNFIQRWSEQVTIQSSQVKEKEISYNQPRVDFLADVCERGGIFIPGRFKRIFVNDVEHGAPYLTGGSVLQADPLAGAKFLSYRFTSNMDELALRERMILVTCSGTIGNSAYINANFKGAVGSPDLLRVLANPIQIPPGYLYAFLNSSLGKALIEKQTYGAVIPHIEAHHVLNLPIPRLDTTTEHRIHELIEQAASLKVKARDLLESAQEEVFRFCKLRRLTSREALTKGCLIFSLPRSQYGQFALTAWTYNPITRAAISRIQTQQYALLSDVVQPNGIFYGHQFKRIDADSSVGIMLLSQAHVFQERPQGRWISKKSVPDHREYMVPDGAILVAAQGTMGENELYGHCQFSHRNFENCMITQHILRIIPDAQKINPGYLFAFLSSESGFHLFRSTACGTKLLGFILGLVQQFPVPLVERKYQDEIGDMVYQAYDNRAEALLLEDQAQALLAKALGLKTDTFVPARPVLVEADVS